MGWIETNLLKYRETIPERTFKQTFWVCRFESFPLYMLSYIAALDLQLLV